MVERIKEDRFDWQLGEQWREQQYFYSKDRYIIMQLRIRYETTVASSILFSSLILFDVVENF